MKIDEINNEINNQRQLAINDIHSMIANKLGIKKLYTESTLWCEITDIDLRFHGQLTISTSTFTYKLGLGGHEILEYKLIKSINNAPNYYNIKRTTIEDHTIDLRGKLETTCNLLKAIMSVKKDILKRLEEFKNFNYEKVQI